MGSVSLHGNKLIKLIDICGISEEIKKIALFNNRRVGNVGQILSPSFNCKNGNPVVLSYSRLFYGFPHYIIIAPLYAQSNNFLIRNM